MPGYSTTGAAGDRQQQPLLVIGCAEARGTERYSARRESERSEEEARRGRRALLRGVESAKVDCARMRCVVSRLEAEATVAARSVWMSASAADPRQASTHPV